jgi:post-segregation antitoxin (ccd killing protein)
MPAGAVPARCEETADAHIMRIQPGGAQVRTSYDLSARKRPVNLTLNEDLVTKARNVTDNLSAVVEALLADFVSREQQRRTAEAKLIKEAVSTWNTFAEEHGSFSDEHSTL